MLSLWDCETVINPKYKPGIFIDNIRWGKEIAATCKHAQVTVWLQILRSTEHCIIAVLGYESNY